jgi:CheY-like chemotaxis protein
MSTPLVRVNTSLCRILVVDDHHDSVAALSMLLEYEGHAVAVANSGRTALELVESFRPHIALVDIAMPEMDGYEVARCIRAQASGSRIYLVALTGWARLDDKAKALAAGFDLHVAKPVDVQKLDHLINQFDCSQAKAS